MSELSKTAHELLIKIVEAGKSGTYADLKKLSTLVKAGMVEVREDHTDDKGRVAVRATEAGINATKVTDESEGETQSAPTEPKETDTMTNDTISAIADNVPMPTTVLASSSRHKFDDLDVNQSFFVAATEDKPDPAKSLGGAVNNANMRHSELTGTNVIAKRGKLAGKEVPERRALRKFCVRRVEDGAPWGFPGVSGAAVWRVALDS